MIKCNGFLICFKLNVGMTFLNFSVSLSHVDCSLSMIHSFAPAALHHTFIFHASTFFHALFSVVKFNE